MALDGVADGHADQDEAGVARDVEALRVLGHGLRFAILSSLVLGEQSVSHLAAATRQSLSLVSQQLALLRKAELVRTRRAAKQVFYRLAPGRIHELAAMLSAMADGATMAESARSPGEGGAKGDLPSLNG